MKHLNTVRTPVLLCLALAFAGCGQTGNEPAGAFLDRSNFGNATMNNTLAQTGQLDLAISLTQRFSRETQNTVGFAFNSDQLDGAAMAALDRQADWIRQFPEIRFRVYGHTDLVGSNSYNKSLGLRRAQSVVSYLSTRGISRSRLEAVVSYGETQPLVYTPGPEARNRRTVTEVSGFVKSDPMLLDGQYAEVIFREYVESATYSTKTTAPSTSTSE
jgi:outer membrane protein OmpA-like peptidoglycan-associated protein